MERVCFQLGGNEVETNIVVVDSAHGLEYFLLARNFLRAYIVLVDLKILSTTAKDRAVPGSLHVNVRTVATPRKLND